MKIHRFRFNKLVRDKTPERVIARKFTMKYRVLDDQEYVLCLKNKLQEEAREVHETTDQSELREELADVLEVLHALIKASGFSYADIERLRQEKIIERGGFDKKIFGISIDIASDNPYIEYYFKRPREYPEEPCVLDDK